VNKKQLKSMNCACKKPVCGLGENFIVSKKRKTKVKSKSKSSQVKIFYYPSYFTTRNFIWSGPFTHSFTPFSNHTSL